MERLFATALLMGAAVAGPAGAEQITLAPSAVINSSGDYSPQFAAGSIFDNQTATVSEPAQTGYWLNPDNGPANAFLTIDLGRAYSLSSFTLFNTHNSFYNDRGTGTFSIVGASTLGGLAAATTLVSGTLNAVGLADDPIVGQSFASTDAGQFRYLQFRPTSVATQFDGVHTSPCCGANVYGLNELRVFGSVPEPASWALMISGFSAIGVAMRRRTKARIAFA